MPRSPDRHATLLAEGWIYDVAQDRYRAPGSDPRTAAWHNRDGAWLARGQGAGAAPAPAESPAAEAPKDRGDPRRSRPL